MYIQIPAGCYKRATRALAVIVGLASLATFPLDVAQAAVSQVPLAIGTGSVPGNLALVPSVEYPTVNSVANIGDYSASNTYVGYFDATKCYKYSYDSSNSSNDHFYPSSITTNHQCSGSGEWSGNFLDWATTQTIDPFRKALTGGYRVKDTPTETWLQKARQTGQGGTGVFPNRRIPASGTDSSLVAGATPFDAGYIRMQIEGLGDRMYFRLDNDNTSYNVTDYDPSQDITDTHGYQVHVRVKVCDPSVGVEANCVPYSQGWKPEGLIQQYADSIRFSVFGYLNDSNVLRDGGVLRAQQQYVGPEKLDPSAGWVSNPNAEWDASTGVLIQNPNSADATATDSSINHSGVINYINEFGELNDDPHKSYDPVSELYYTALRYFENLGNVSAYSDLSGASSTSQKDQWMDGFPVITNWDDPIAYACQKNVILGIGDENTHRDKDLPGNTTYRTDEPTMPSEVASDNSVDVISLTDKVGALEGLGTIGETNSFSGRYNSAYMAGLAYYAHTSDIRSDMSGMQTISTYWVDVMEGQIQQPPSRNQYYLATKYGGFTVPDGYSTMGQTSALPLSEWNTTGDTYRASDGKYYYRPDNYYAAGQASLMVDSLTKAFASISSDITSSSASVSANSTSLNTDSAVYQATYTSRHWSGQLLAYKVDTTGTVASSATWDAAALLDARTETNVTSDRNILTALPLAAQTDGSELTTTGADFKWSSLAASQQTDLEQSTASASSVSSTVAQQRLNYLRGSRQYERTTTNQSLPFRQRDSRLGDIINSRPQNYYHDDFGYEALSQVSAFSSVSSYADFRASSTYQNRPPMVVVGANDGMLHGFRADVDNTNGGQELFAYVPASVYPNLYQLTLPDYSHHYYVDGTPRVADAWLGSTLGWRTIAVGTTGAGGNSVFALDVTDPQNMTSSQVLWEFSDPDMGKTIEQPAVVALADGKFGVVVTSGYDSTASNGKIWILNAADGTVIRKIDVPGSGAFGSPLVVDLNGDRVADRIYVADTLGKLWRFDIDSANPSSWGAPASLTTSGKPVPLFQDADINGSAQPITAPLSAALDTKGEPMVFFGTGSFINSGDNVLPSSPQVNTFYGIIDRGAAISGRSTLLKQSIVAQQSTTSGVTLRAVSNNEIASSNNGWYLDLLYNDKATGERVVSQATLSSGRVIFSTLIPSSDPCKAGGDSILMELNAFNGGRLSYSVLDVNNDGSINNGDYMTITDPDGNKLAVPVSGMGLGIGITGKATILTGAPGGNEIKVFSGSSGQIKAISEKGGSVNAGRQSWEQLR